jgi:hypothetical protein
MDWCPADTVKVCNLIPQITQPLRLMLEEVALALQDPWLAHHFEVLMYDN